MATTARSIPYGGGSGGAAPNPTDKYIPINDAGAFADSPIYVDPLGKLHTLLEFVIEGGVDTLGNTIIVGDGLAMKSSGPQAIFQSQITSIKYQSPIQRVDLSGTGKTFDVPLQPNVIEIRQPINNFPLTSPLSVETIAPNNEVINNFILYTNGTIRDFRMRLTSKTTGNIIISYPDKFSYDRGEGVDLIGAGQKNLALYDQDEEINPQPNTYYINGAAPTRVLKDDEFLLEAEWTEDGGTAMGIQVSSMVSSSVQSQGIDISSSVNQGGGFPYYGVGEQEFVFSDIAHEEDVVLQTEKAVANGVATLDGGGKVPAAQLPIAIQGGIRVLGFWDASLNIPDLNSLTPDQGDAYQVSVAGTTNINGETDWQVRDLVVWDDALAGNWFKLDSADEVLSVAGKTGAVLLDTDDVTEATNLYFTEQRVSNTPAVQNNTAHRTSDGKDHSDVVLNNTHRGITTGNPHNVLATQITDFDTEVSNNSDVTANTAKVSFPEAPIDGKRYERKDGAWVEDPMDLTDEPTGYLLNSITGEVDLVSSEMSFVNGTRTFTIQPKLPATEFSIVQGGELYTFSTPQTIIIPDTEGIHYIYFNNGTLISTTSFDIGVIYDKVFTAVVYWDATNKESILLGDERHGSRMDGHTHARLHQKDGTIYLGGMDLNDFDLGSGTLDSDAQFSVSLGAIRDEDITISRDAIAVTTGCPILYKLGATGTWRREFNAGFSVLTTGTGRLAWNEDVAGTWQKTEVSNNDFVLCHVFASNDVEYPFFAVMGQDEYLTRGNAREGATVEINNLITSGLPFTEFVALGTVIFKTSNGYVNAVKAKIETTDEGDNYVDWRGTVISPSGGVDAIEHNLTLGKQGGTIGEYYHLTSAQVTNLDNQSGTNTGDQDLSGLQPILAEGSFIDGDKTKLNGIEAGAEVNNISDVNATDLTDGGETTLHHHDSDRDRANHTGTQSIATVDGLQSELDNKALKSNVLGYVLATWGANLQNVGKHPAQNGSANGPEISNLGISASAVVPAAGTIDTLTYYNATGDNTTVFQIIKNGVVTHTFTCTGPYGVETGIDVPTGFVGTVPDNIAIRYASGTAPGEGFYSMYIN